MKLVDTVANGTKKITTQITIGLFHLQMIILFTFLLAKGFRKLLLIIITRIFNSHVHRGYICKVSVHLVQKYFPYDCSTDSLSCSK